jgi:two-component system, cell cycle sensor histidine kinase and response regulator CckA
VYGRGIILSLRMAYKKKEEFSRAAPPGRPVVLLVEHYPAVRRLIRVLLESEKCVVLAAASTEEAVARSRSYPGGIDLLLVDIDMSGENGHDVFEAVMRERPGMKVLAISANADQIDIERSRSLPLLEKPFTPGQLLQAVCAALTAPQARRATE